MSQSATSFLCIVTILPMNFAVIQIIRPWFWTKTEFSDRFSTCLTMAMKVCAGNSFSTNKPCSKRFDVNDLMMEKSRFVFNQRYDENNFSSSALPDFRLGVNLIENNVFISLV